MKEQELIGEHDIEFEEQYQHTSHRNRTNLENKNYMQLNRYIDLQL